jgi:Na+-driven multidrug efflux pump
MEQKNGIESLKVISLGMISVGVLGVFATLLLIFGAATIFSFFIPEEGTLSYGVDYLRILGVSQLFMCIEIATAGAFNGMGKTMPPSLVSTVFTGLRIPMALILSSPNILGLNGIWWSISITSIIKGMVLFIWFEIHLKISNSKRINTKDIILVEETL